MAKCPHCDKSLDPACERCKDKGYIVVHFTISRGGGMEGKMPCFRCDKSKKYREKNQNEYRTMTKISELRAILYLVELSIRTVMDAECPSEERIVTFEEQNDE